MSRDHAETLRLKDTLLEDFAGQLAEAKRELQRRAAALTDAERRRDAAAHEAEALASAQETIAVQEGAISRLEAKTEEIELGCRLGGLELWQDIGVWIELWQDVGVWIFYCMGVGIEPISAS